MPSKIYHDIEESVVTVSGTGSVNSTIGTRGTGVLFYVHPATDTTKWDLKIIDPKDRVVRHYREQTGTLADQDSNELPMLGIYTFLLENTTCDEKFDIFIRVEQVHG